MNLPGVVTSELKLSIDLTSNVQLGYSNLRTESNIDLESVISCSYVKQLWI